MAQDTEDHCLDRVEELSHRRTMLIGRSKADGDKSKSWNTDAVQVIIEMFLNGTNQLQFVLTSLALKACARST